MWGKKKFKQIDSVPSLTQPIPLQSQPILQQAEQRLDDIRKQIDIEEESEKEEFLLEMEQWKEKIETYLKNKFFEIDMRLSKLE